MARAASKVSTTKPGLRSQDSFRDRMKRIAKDATDKADNQTTEEMAEEEAQRKQGVLDLLTPWQRLVRSNKFQYSIFFCILFNYTILRDTKDVRSRAVLLNRAGRSPAHVCARPMLRRCSS